MNTPSRGKAHCNVGWKLSFSAPGPLQDAATNPLDDTRIHPECYFDTTEGISYDFAQKICSDALDRDFDRGMRKMYFEAETANEFHGRLLLKSLICGVFDINGSIYIWKRSRLLKSDSLFFASSSVNISSLIS